jgi:hypothetical protein
MKTELIVSPPYVSPNLPVGVRARGSLRNKNTGTEIIFTGPTMRVVYSGCKWNTIVFCMDSSQIEFENWLSDIWDTFQQIVRSDPAKYKVAFRSGPGFPAFIVTPSTDPEIYPNELRCRLATYRDMKGEQVCSAVLLNAQSGQPVEPTSIWSGGMVTPIFKLGYYKNGDNFGLTLTVLRADYTPPTTTQISNEDWAFDYDEENQGENASGSSSEMALDN